MAPDVADDVIGLTNSVGSAVYDIQRARAAFSSLRRGAAAAAKHPGGIALAGVSLLATSAVLALRQSRAETAGQTLAEQPSTAARQSDSSAPADV